jgi:hypothetical protein
MLVETEKLEHLSLVEQIDLLEKISQAMEKNASAFAPPAWHQAVLESRAHSLESPETWLTLSEVKAKFRG